MKASAGLLWGWKQSGGAEQAGKYGKGGQELLQAEQWRVPGANHSWAGQLSWESQSAGTAGPEAPSVFLHPSSFFWV